MTDDSTNTGRRRFLVGSTSVVGAAGVAKEMGRCPQKNLIQLWQTW